MAHKADLLAALLRTSKESAFYNINRLEELQSKDYPYATSHEFINALIKINKGVLTRIEELDKSPPSSDEDFKDRLLETQRYGQTLGSLHSLLQILELGKREYIPQGMVDLIEQSIISCGSSPKILLLPSYDYNYAYVEVTEPLRNSLKDVLPNIEDILNFAGKFAVFWFPLAHRDNTMLNVLLSHEIGHFLSQERQIVAKILSRLNIDKRKIGEIAEEWLHTKLAAEKKEIQLVDYFGLETAKTQVVRDVVSKVSEQLEELVSDSIAFHLFGPAFMIAIGNYLATSADMNLEPRGYPSSRTRMRFLIEGFEEAKYLAIVKAFRDDKETIQCSAAKTFVGIIDTWKDFIEKEKLPASGKVSELVREVIESSKSILREEVHSVVGAYEFTAKRFGEESFRLIDTIDSFVPPAEIEFEHPADPIAILNAGMLYELTLMENMHEKLKDKELGERLLTIHKLHKLIVKGIEASQTQLKMKNKKSV